MLEPRSTWSQVGGILVPTYTPVAWQNIMVVPGYRVSFQLISRNIVLTIPVGISSEASVKRVHELRNRFLLETIGESAHYIEIRDYQHIPGLPDRASRRQQVDEFYNNVPLCNGFISCNVNPMLQTMMRVGLLLMSSPFPYKIVKGLEEAIKEALILEQRIGQQWNEDYSNRIRLDAWNCKLSDFSVEAEVIAPSVFVLKLRGVLRDSSIEPLQRLQEQVLESGAVDLNSYIRVIDYSGLKSFEWSARSIASRDVMRLFEQYGFPVHSYICGANTFVKAAIWIFFPSLRSKISFVQSEQDALLRIRNRDVFPVEEEEKRVRDHQASEDPEIRKLVQDIAQISWKKQEPIIPSVPEDHRFYSVYEAIRLIAMDIQEATEISRTDHFHLEQAQHALEAAGAKRVELVRVANHELRTPLNGLMGILELMEVHPNPSTEMQSYIETAKECAEDLRGILLKLIDFSSLEVGRFELQNKAFVPHDIIANMENKYSVKFQHRGIGFHCSETGDLNEPVIGDSHRLEQIIEIFLDNAGKFTAQGYIELMAHATMLNQKVNFLFQVKDTGLGIREEDMDKVFEPFGRGDYGFARKFGTAGLGLSVAHQIAEVLGASLKAESHIGKGSSFSMHIELPREKR